MRYQGANGLVAEKSQQKVFEILQREIQQSLESRCDEQTEGARLALDNDSLTTRCLLCGCQLDDLIVQHRQAPPSRPGTARRRCRSSGRPGAKSRTADAFNATAKSGTVLTLVFLPALYAIWFKIKQVPEDRQLVSATGTTSVPGEMERSLVGTL